MRKVFEHPASHEVGHYDSILQSHGIGTVIRNQNVSSLIGEVPFVAAYPELWVVNDEDYDRAISLLSEYRRSLPSGEAADWTCANCREEVPGTFPSCWKCHSPRTADERAPYLENTVVEQFPSEAVEGGGSPLRYPLTLACAIVAALVFIWKTVAPEAAMTALSPYSTEIYAGRWDGLLGSVFVHGDFMHLAFNLYWLWTFGSVLEANVRRGLWILVFLACAVFSSAAQLAFGGEAGIGLSGAVYGLFGFLWFAQPRYPTFAAVLKKNIVMLMLGWLVLCFVLTAANIYQVANSAHVGGLVAGMLLGWLVVRSRQMVPYACGALIVLSLASVMYAPWSPSFLVARASALLQKGETGKASVLLERLAQSDGYFATWAANTLAFIHEQNGDYSGAAKVYEAALPKSEKDVSFLNGYAWLLATAPEAGVRDGRKAVKLALSAAELTAWKDAAVLDTLAAAYAETGDFATAIKWQTTVSEMGLEGDDVRQRLELYQQGKAFRDKPAARP